MEKKIGIYICSGCEIGNCIDIDSLKNKISDKYPNIKIKSNSFLCSKDALSEINNDIEKENFEAIVVAACSPRVKVKEFNFSNNIICERVNFREQIAWLHLPMNEDTQMLAEDSLNMAIAKIKTISVPKPFIAENLNSDLLVVGGGITGITAAIEASKAGYSIVLIEKEKKIGGWSNYLYKQIPSEFSHTELQNPIIIEKIDEIENLKNIQIFTSSEIIEISGQPGEFIVKFLRDKQENTLKVGAIIWATGWKPYDANNLNHLGYNKHSNIITNLEFEKMVNNRKILKPSDQKEPKSILFIQCAGSRDKNHLPYCSNYCCLTTLKQVVYITELIPSALVYVIYNDIRTPGPYENFYKSVQNHDQVFFTKGDVSAINKINSNLVLEINDSLINEKVQVE
ncbi:MAG: CoB--CoM heterodisulfide reductase iron-sulfur subunit A family protein, partial [Bacteroidales bacterium]|nr:CoB--CoM heterodisulfide reductase iron-sulfur subunit A family protein [Bacteroidales bacterium]